MLNLIPLKMQRRSVSFVYINMRTIIFSISLVGVLLIQNCNTLSSEQKEQKICSIVIERDISDDFIIVRIMSSPSIEEQIVFLLNSNSYYYSDLIKIEEEDIIIKEINTYRMDVYRDDSLLFSFHPK